MWKDFEGAWRGGRENARRGKAASSNCGYAYFADKESPRCPTKRLRTQQNTKLLEQSDDHDKSRIDRIFKKHYVMVLALKIMREFSRLRTLRGCRFSCPITRQSRTNYQSRTNSQSVVMGGVARRDSQSWVGWSRPKNG